MHMLSVCDRVKERVTGPVLVEELDSREDRAQRYDSAVPTLVLNGVVKARGEVPDEEALAAWLHRPLDNGEEARLELILGGAGCERYAEVKRMVEEIIREYRQEAELIEIGEQNQSMEELTSGDMALVIDGRLHTFFGRTPSRKEVLLWMTI